MSVSSSPPPEPTSSSIACSGRPLSSSAAARSAAASAEWKLLSAPRLRSKLSCAAASARSTSPLRSAADERPMSVQTSACVLPSTRAASIPPSSSSPASASFPRWRQSPPSVVDQKEEELPLAGGTRDGERAIGVRVALGVTVEVELHAAEPGRGFDASGELSSDSESTSAAASTRSNSARSAAPMIESARASSARAAASSGGSPSRLAASTARPAQLMDVVVLRAPDRVHCELDHQLHRLGRFLVRQPFEGAFEVAMRVLLPSKEAFDRRTGSRDSGLQRRRVGHDRGSVEQGRVAVRVSAGRGERAGAVEEKLDAVSRRRGRREQAERFAIPVRGAGRREPDGFVSGRAQDGRGVDVALARRALDMMGAGRCRGASICERVGAALVSAQPPTACSCLVDGGPHERVPEAETPWHVGGAEKIESQELVDGLHHRPLGQLGRCGRQLGLEGVSCHRRPFQDEARAIRQQRELVADRCCRRSTGLRSSPARSRREPPPPHQRGRATARAARGRKDCRRSPHRGRSRRLARRRPRVAAAPRRG